MFSLLRCDEDGNGVYEHALKHRFYLYRLTNKANPNNDWQKDVWMVILACNMIIMIKKSSLQLTVSFQRFFYFHSKIVLSRSSETRLEITSDGSCICFVTMNVPLTAQTDYGGIGTVQQEVMEIGNEMNISKF